MISLKESEIFLLSWKTTCRYLKIYLVSRMWLKIQFDKSYLNCTNESHSHLIVENSRNVCTAEDYLRLSIYSRSCCICTLFTPDLYLSNNRSAHLPGWSRRRGEMGNSCEYLLCPFFGASELKYFSVSLCVERVKIYTSYRRKLNLSFRNRYVPDRNNSMIISWLLQYNINIIIIYNKATCSVNSFMACTRERLSA